MPVSSSKFYATNLIWIEFGRSILRHTAFADGEHKKRQVSAQALNFREITLPEVSSHH